MLKVPKGNQTAKSIGGSKVCFFSLCTVKIRRLFSLISSNYLFQHFFDRVRSFLFSSRRNTK